MFKITIHRPTAWVQLPDVSADNPLANAQREMVYTVRALLPEEFILYLNDLGSMNSSVFAVELFFGHTHWRSTIRHQPSTKVRIPGRKAPPQTDIIPKESLTFLVKLTLTDSYDMGEVVLPVMFIPDDVVYKAYLEAVRLYDKYVDLVEEDWKQMKEAEAAARKQRSDVSKEQEETAMIKKLRRRGFSVTKKE